MLQLNNINLIGIASGVTIIALIITSFFIPWWQLIVGDALIEAKVSPIYTYFNFIGDSFTIPIIWALNIASIITLAVAGIIMLIYSINPTKSYSKQLLNFAYKKPLYSIIFFLLGLILTIYLITSVFSFQVPIFGTILSIMPTGMTQGAIITVQMSAEFVWPFFMAILAVALSIGTKIYHNRKYE